MLAYGDEGEAAAACPTSVLERRAAIDSIGQSSSALKGSEQARSRISDVGATTLATTQTSWARTRGPDDKRAQWN